MSGRALYENGEFECLICGYCSKYFQDIEEHECQEEDVERYILKDTAVMDGYSPLIATPIPDNGDPTTATPPTSPIVRQSRVFPGIGPLSNDGDPGRVWPIMNASSDTDDSTRYMDHPLKYGYKHVDTTSRAYVFEESNSLGTGEYYPGTACYANILHLRCSVQVRGNPVAVPVTWCFSQTLIGPAITLHAVFSSMVQDPWSASFPTSLLILAGCLEDLESYMSLSLILSRTRIQELEYLTRIISVSLPPSFECDSFIQSLLQKGVVSAIGPNGEFL